MLAQSPEPEAHDKVLDDNPDRMGIWNCWFLRTERRNPEYPEKISPHKGENQQQTQPHNYDTESGNRALTVKVLDFKMFGKEMPTISSDHKGH